MARGNHVYDKAKYHEDSIAELGLARSRAFVWTGVYLGWLTERGFVRKDVETGWLLGLFRWRLISPGTYYEWAHDGCLLEDMLSDEANRFSRTYFDFERGRYLEDYVEVMGEGAGDAFTTSFSWRRYRQMLRRLDERLAEWKAQAPPAVDDGTAEA